MDKIGFEARVRALWPGMVRLARCVTHSHADAEDAAAQAVLNCYRRLATSCAAGAAWSCAATGPIRLPARTAARSSRRF